MKKPEKKESLSQKAYDWIFDNLMQKKIKAGEIINRRDIAKKINLSLAPVAEAMMKLENDGFLMTLPRSGTLVRGVDAATVRNLLVLRIAIEVQAARMYASKIPEKAYKKLFLLAQKMDNVKTSNINWKLEVQFHSALVELSGCGSLISVFESVMKRSLFYSVYEIFPNDTPASHKKLLENLNNATKTEAEKLIREHIAKRADLDT